MGTQWLCAVKSKFNNSEALFVLLLITNQDSDNCFQMRDFVTKNQNNVATDKCKDHDARKNTSHTKF